MLVTQEMLRTKCSEITLLVDLLVIRSRAKIVKEGHAVTLNRVMEIARLEVSTQQHLDRMQETAKSELRPIW